MLTSQNRTTGTIQRFCDNTYYAYIHAYIVRLSCFHIFSYFLTLPTKLLFHGDVYCPRFCAICIIPFSICKRQKTFDEMVHNLVLWSSNTRTIGVKCSCYTHNIFMVLFCLFFAGRIPTFDLQLLCKSIIINELLFLMCFTNCIGYFPILR